MSAIMLARALRPGVIVEDNLTAWAEVLAVRPAHTDKGTMFEVRWLLADGTTETEYYLPTDAFTPTSKGETQ